MNPWLAFMIMIIVGSNVGLVVLSLLVASSMANPDSQVSFIKDDRYRGIYQPGVNR